MAETENSTSLLPQVRFELEHPSLLLGLVRARGVRVHASPPPLLAAMAAAEQAVRSDAQAFPEATRAAIRDLLRVGGYKPTGRGKPASEFLLGVAREAGMPRVNNLVDINNLASLKSAHPISIFDFERLGADIAIRFGRAGERYVFNASGQEMDLAGLPVVCRGPTRKPVGNAVKDSMLAKVHEGTQDVLVVVYGTDKLPQAALVAVCEDLAALLRQHAGAQEVATGTQGAAVGNL